MPRGTPAVLSCYLRTSRAFFYPSIIHHSFRSSSRHQSALCPSTPSTWAEQTRGSHPLFAHRSVLHHQPRAMSHGALPCGLTSVGSVCRRMLWLSPGLYCRDAPGSVIGRGCSEGFGSSVSRGPAAWRGGGWSTLSCLSGAGAEER
ncbi:hypothetical protein DPEC_G00314230 [Dallia pectoralis]|uniref:Uncharacterized protein n=1 Tax=Dallia pectoralis TaxID=75939 RepID=A0ACC2FC43_DALPE|nr:hypothetical protein DPEC_G00314230 [Dallia pectoralis]